MIYLYLTFKPEAEYNSSWTFVSYTILRLEASEEQNFTLFAHLIHNLLSVTNWFFFCVYLTNF